MPDAMAILLVCYKIEAGRGSEDESGYQIARALIRRGYRLTIVSRCNNVDLLRKDPAFSGVQLVGVDVPRALAFYKRGGRGIVAYYYLWQLLVGYRVWRLQRDQKFDVLHQLNFHTDWAPHFLYARHGATLVWGPMSHHKRVPLSFLSQRRLRDLARESVKTVVKRAFWHIDPFLRRAIRRTDRVLYADDDVAPPFRRSIERITYRPYAASSPSFMDPPVGGSDFVVLSVGRLVPLKGFATTVKAFATFWHRAGTPPTARLEIVGSGELDAELRRLAAELGIADHVRFTAWAPRAELAAHYRAASVFLYPSFEAQGLVVAEAMSASVPVICLERTGPAFLAASSGIVLRRGPRATVVQHAADSLQTLYEEFVSDGGNGRFTARRRLARLEYDRRLDWEVVASSLSDIYASTHEALTAAAVP